MSEEIKSGIYEIRNTVTGKVYIGSAIDFRSRWNAHLSQLRRGVHHSIKLQRSWNKHGQDSFTFSVVEPIADITKLILIEQVWIIWTKCHKEGYNMSPTAGSNKGVVPSQETRDKIGDANRGMVRTEETKARMSASAPKTRPPLSDQHKQKIALTLTGHTRTQESRDKQSESCKGRVLSVEQRAKMSLSMKGKNTGPHSPDHVEKLREAAKGNSYARGTKRTGQQKLVMSEKSKEVWAKRKAAKLLEELEN